MRHYTANPMRPFIDTWRQIKIDVLQQPFTTTGQWQSQDTDVKTRELMGVVLEYRLPRIQHDLDHEVQPNQPWAEDHFQERVCGIPLNPPPSEAYWPFNQNGNAAHKFGKHGRAEQFSHTYPERFWPKKAGIGEHIGENYGIRFKFGDLGDVVELLRRAPGTRQAYLPVWFPEDTGTVHGQRVPCSLGYHFMIRGGQLHTWYYMRSCDLIRHFPDDVYMAGRLTQWICDQLNENPGEWTRAEKLDLRAGVLTMSISSLHTFESDDYSLEQLRREMRVPRGAST